MKLTQSFVSLFALSLVLFNGSSVVQASELKSSIPIDSIAMQATNFKSGANRVTFQSEGEKMVGVLYLPKSYKSGDKLPTVIVTGAWMTIKEQMPSIYAQKLADRGYATFVFDFRTWGESGGKLRNFESPIAKITDIKNAVSFLQTVDAVDGNRIAGLGICASAGYMVVAAAEDARIKSLITVAPWIHNPQIVEAVYGGRPTVEKLIATGKEAKANFKQTDKVDSVLATSKTDKTAVMFGDIDYYQNPNRGAIPKWSNQFALASWSEWLTFNPMPIASQIKVPTLFIHSEKAAIPDGARQFFAAIPIKNKQINWLSDRTQFDFYDQESTVNQSISLIADRLKSTL